MPEFADEMTAYAAVAHELVTMRAVLREFKEDQERREMNMWRPILADEEMTNDRKRKAAYEAAALDDTAYQDLLATIQLKHDAIAHEEVNEQFHKMWARFLTAVADRDD